MAHTEIERGAPFCANPVCALHVRVRDGRIFGRSRFGDSLLCDACARRDPVRLAESYQEAKRRRARQ